MEERGDARLKVIVTDDVKNAIFTLPESKKIWMTNTRRPGCVLVMNDASGQLPTFKKTDKGELTSQLNSAYEKWKFTATDERVMMYTAVFHDQFFKDYAVETFGYAHEAKAIISNYGREGTIKADEWWVKVYADTEMLNAWWHSPVPIFHEEGVQFSLPVARMSYDNQLGFTYADVAPEVRKEKEATIEGVPEDEEVGGDEQGDVDLEDEEGAEGLDGLDDLIFG